MSEESFNIENRIIKNGLTLRQFKESDAFKALSEKEQAEAIIIFDQFNTDSPAGIRLDEQQLNLDEQGIMMSYFKALAGDRKHDRTITYEDFIENIKNPTVQSMFSRNFSFNRLDIKEKYKAYEAFMKVYSSVLDNDSSSMSVRFGESFGWANDGSGQVGDVLLDIDKSTYFKYNNFQRDSIVTDKQVGSGPNGYKLHIQRFGDGRFDVVHQTYNDRQRHVSLQFNYNAGTLSMPSSIDEIRQLTTAGTSGMSTVKKTVENTYSFDNSNNMYTPDNGKTYYVLGTDGLLARHEADVEAPPLNELRRINPEIGIPTDTSGTAKTTLTAPPLNNPTPLKPSIGASGDAVTTQTPANPQTTTVRKTTVPAMTGNPEISQNPTVVQDENVLTQPLSASDGNAGQTPKVTLSPSKKASDLGEGEDKYSATGQALVELLASPLMKGEPNSSVTGENGEIYKYDESGNLVNVIIEDNENSVSTTFGIKYVNNAPSVLSEVQRPVSDTDSKPPLILSVIRGVDGKVTYCLDKR